MSDINNKGFDEIILDQDLDLKDPSVFYALSKCYEEGRGVEEHQALADFFKRVAESLEKKEAPKSFFENREIVIDEEDEDIFDVEENDEEFEELGEIDNPFDEEKSFDVKFYQESHSNTKDKLIEEAKAKYQKEIQNELGLEDKKEIELIMEGNEEEINEEESISPEETYREALRLIDNDKYEEGLSKLKTIGDMENVDEEILARTLFVLALAYPDEEYSRYATDIAWKNKNEEYAKEFLDYFYNHDCGEAYLDSLDKDQLDYLGIQEDDGDWLDIKFHAKKEDTGSGSILHETANLEKLILEDDE